MLEVHAHGIIENIEPGFVLFLFNFWLFHPVHLGLIDDFDLQAAELDINLVEIFRTDNAIRQRIVDVGVGQITLLLSETNKFFDLVSEQRRLPVARFAIGRRGERMAVLMAVGTGVFRR